MRTLLPRLVAIAALAASAAASPAGAAQVVRDGDAIVLRGVGAEANHLSAAVDDFAPANLRLSDRTDFPLTADPSLGCTITSSGFGQFASCPATGFTRLRIEGGDGDDELDISPHDLPITGEVILDGGAGTDDLEGPTTDRPVTLLGGPGNDALKGGRGPDGLDGGEGNDQVDGGDGNDTVRGGLGDDVVIGGRTLSADLIDGGPGRDLSKGDWYDANLPENGPLSVTFDGLANDGRPGEGDNVTSVEVIETKRVATLIAGASADAPVEFSVTNTAAGGSKLVGTPFDDRLRTDSSDDVIEAGAGNDAIDAGYGNDVITPGPGRDTVLADGGAGACDLISCPLAQGNDTIDAVDGEVDSISCGPGTDRVTADPVDILAPDCEQTSGGGGTPGPGTPNGGGSGDQKVTFSAVGSTRLRSTLQRGLKVRVRGLTGTVRLAARHGRTTVASGSARSRGGTATVTLRFTARARRQLRTLRKVTLQLRTGQYRGTVTLRR
jgi:Ca2+-binding RTX toxin-like protein